MRKEGDRLINRAHSSTSLLAVLATLATLEVDFPPSLNLPPRSSRPLLHALPDRCRLGTLY